ncbi:MAG: TonB-dependent receptor [Sphingobacteriaceae bacterium]|nr:TonB-dependent receptor [Sphingobacteriaceae bacterium]MBK7310317.1 TonB-dependent receptor [Sphingobacteriaceae bacterium]
MIKKIYFTLAVLILAGFSLIGQDNNGAIKVILIDKATKETIPFANIVAYQGGVQVAVGTTNMDGEVIIKPLRPGKYNVKGVYVGYKPQEIKDIIVGEGKTAYVTIGLSNDGGVQLDEVEVITYQVPLIDPDTKTGQTVTREEYQNLATKDVNSVAATTGGVFQSDDGAGISVRGGRGATTTYFVDGMKIIGGLNLPQQSIGSLEVITGGVPASYGDLTSGAVSISTRGPQSKFFGGVELISSQITDPYGYNSLGFSVGGPIYNKKDSSGNKRTVLGFFVSGQGTYMKEPDPSFLPIYTLTDEKLQQIKDVPLLKSPSGSGYVRSSEYVTKDDMETRKTRINAAARSLSFNGKIDFQPTLNTNITMGGFVEYSGSSGASQVGQIFNAANTAYNTGLTLRPYISLTQKFSTGTASKEKSQSIISNAFFKFQASYEKTKSVSQSLKHKKNYFDYGHIGKFETGKYESELALNYAYDPEFVVNGDTVVAYTYQGGFPKPIVFTPSDKNPDAALYTSYLFSQEQNSIFDLNQVVGNNALRNGDGPAAIYGMYLNFGSYPGGYSETNFNQVRFTASFNADIKNHAVTAGLEFDQRFVSFYGVSGSALWNRMRQISNAHLSNLDFANPILVPQFSGSIPYYYFDYAYQADKQTQFSEKLLEKLGLPKNYNKQINIDEMDPSTFSLDMFSVEDVIDESIGREYVTFVGFDHTGKKNKDDVGIEDFLAKDAAGRNTFPIGVYKPIYSSIYLMDKFDFKDIKINAGLRVDRYDANQKVLKDKYVLHDVTTIGKLKSKTGLPANFDANVPGNRSQDAVIYISNLPTEGNYQISGYREGNTWYDAEGEEISDPALIAANNGRQIPLLMDNSNYTENMSADGFKNYVAAINAMPRLAFSFPISDVANFFAHYDVLTKRPLNFGNRLNPFDYYFLGSQSGNPVVQNADLKPEQTIDYELGFSQILNERKSASMTITSFYREMRNMTQYRAIVGAYPRNYLMLDNLDFGTVKGLTVTFDFRRSGGSSFKANYTLQFAEGSGSNNTSGGNLASSGQPNLRILIPLDNDQRHTINLIYDYRFGSEKDYKGPQIKRKSGKTLNIFEDVGLNLSCVIGSGTPYTRYSTPVALNGGSRSNILGTINGSRLPWSIRSNLRVDKNIPLTWGKKDSENKNTANLNIYLQVLNLFNNRNVLGIYAFTGNPDDDGYLQSSQAVAALATANSPQAFRDLYAIRMANPDFFNKPRQIRIGLLLEF